MPLPLRQDGDRPQSIPALGLLVVAIGDCDGGQRNVADDLSVFFGHDGKRQFVGCAQGTHDELLGMAGVRCIGESRNRDGFDGGNVVRGFVSELEGHGLVFNGFLKI